jgi:hypothetical protein
VTGVGGCSAVGYTSPPQGEQVGIPIMGLYRMTLTSWLVLLDLRPFYAKLSFIHKLMFLVSGPRLNHLPFLPLISPCTPKLLLYFQPNSKGISVSARLLPPIGDDCVCWCSPAPGGALVRPVLGMVQRPCRAWFDIPGVTPKAPPEVTAAALGSQATNGASNGALDKANNHPGHGFFGRNMLPHPDKIQVCIARTCAVY